MSVFELKVVNGMDEQQKNSEQQEEQSEQPQHDGPAGKYIRLKPFFFIMLIFTLILRIIRFCPPEKTR